MPHFTELIDQLPITQHLVSHALDIVCKDKGEGTEEERRAEWLPLFYSPDPFDGTLRPHFSYSGEDPDEAAKRTLDAVPRERWGRLVSRANEVGHPLLSALYFDLLWQQRQRHRFPRPHEFALLAMTKYESAARERFGNLDLFWNALHACQHLGRLARDLNDHGKGPLAARLIGELLDSVQSHWARAPGLPLNAAKALEEFVRSISKARRGKALLDEVGRMLERLRQFMPDGHGLQSTYVGRDVLERMLGLEDLLGIDSRRARLLQQADSRVTEARARGNAGDPLVAGSIMAEAAEQFTALGETEMAAGAKREARSFFRQGTAEMKPIAGSIVISTAPYIAWVNRTAALGSLRASLIEALCGNEIIQDWQVSSANSAKLAERYPLQSLMPAVCVVDGRQVSKEDSGYDDMRRRRWLMGVKMGVTMLWDPLVEKLKFQGLTAQKLVEELVQAGVVPAHNQKALTRAIEAALNGDYFVACHMLPPIIESAIRHVCSEAGIDMTAFRPKDGGQFQERTMGALFDDEPSSSLVQNAIKLFGEDLWNWYRTVLFDERSLNLRNRSAHGLLHDEECSADTSQTLLLALVALLRLKSKAEDAMASAAT